LSACWAPFSLCLSHALGQGATHGWLHGLRNGTPCTRTEHGVATIHGDHTVFPCCPAHKLSGSANLRSGEVETRRLLILLGLEGVPGGSLSAQGTPRDARRTIAQLSLRTPKMEPTAILPRPQRHHARDCFTPASFQDSPLWSRRVSPLASASRSSKPDMFWFNMPFAWFAKQKVQNLADVDMLRNAAGA
jgi:hypothetical protein